MTSRQIWPFLKPCHAWSSFPTPTSSSVTSFIVHEMGKGVSMRTPQKLSFQIIGPKADFIWNAK